MGKTSIEWTDASWNPIVGCTEVSPGCANCYAARLAATRLKETSAYKGLAGRGVLKSGPWWTGEVRFLPERLEEPLHWREPRRIFVCDMGDLFHENVSDEQIVQIFKTIALGGGIGHTFQVLTKRAKRLHDFMLTDHHVEWVRPMPWLWLGVSVENQHFANQRIPLLLDTPAAVRFISAEPLLEAVDIYKYLPPGWRYLNWVICGGENGTDARQMHQDWARSLRDQCQAAGVPFFFKQWGEWVDPQQNVCALHSAGKHGYVTDTRKHSEGCQNKTRFILKVGKKESGRLLDGREWSEFPEVKR